MLPLNPSQRLAVDLVRALFCGMSGMDNRMEVFIAASDETADRERVGNMYYSGYVASVDDWTTFFTPAWQERVLDGPPSIPYLHMTDVRSAKWRATHGKGITVPDADRRVREGCDVISQL